MISSLKDEIASLKDAMLPFTEEMLMNALNFIPVYQTIKC